MISILSQIPSDHSFKLDFSIILYKYEPFHQSFIFAGTNQLKKQFKILFKNEFFKMRRKTQKLVKLKLYVVVQFFFSLNLIVLFLQSVCVCVFKL